MVHGFVPSLLILLISLNVSSSELEILPWKKLNMSAEGLEVSAELDGAESFKTLSIKTGYGTYSLPKEYRELLTKPKLSTLEAVLFPGIKTDEYHLQFYYHKLGFDERQRNCIKKGGELRDDYVRIKVKSATDVEVKMFDSTCTFSSFLGG